MLFARHNRVHDCVCVNFMKKSFSQSVSEPEFLFSTYNISTDQSKDDSNLETAGDYVLNTLLVGIFVCPSVCQSINSKTPSPRLAKLCMLLANVPLQKPIDFGAN